MFSSAAHSLLRRSRRLDSAKEDLVGAPRVVHPPGTLLQHMYMKERLAKLRPGCFVEVGTGNGHISHLLLAHGWRGVGYDLSASALARAEQANARHVACGRFTVRNEDWLAGAGEDSVDLVISSMVLEHLDDEEVDRYFSRAASMLQPGGRGILLVPGSPRHWGIEDEIAGNLRRDTVASLSATVRDCGWRPVHTVGLAHPLANLLLGTSNLLVRRSERDKRALTLRERTERSGDRAVGWKTDFPPWAGVLLNEATLRPFHWWQKRHGASPDALVVYCEFLPPGSSGPAECA